MSIATNIETVLGFKTTDRGHTLRPAELQAAYPQCKRTFGGSNFYYGLNDENLETFTSTSSPLNDTHQAFFSDMVEALLSGSEPMLTIVLGVEPPSVPQPFAYVDQHIGLVEALATSLGAYQVQVKEQSGGQKTLRIFIRYASEMNDTTRSGSGPSNPYGGMPEAYRLSFQKVRTIFRTAAPDILFSFSPAIRRDLAEPVLSEYWPGPEFVDVISCTWYIGGSSQVTGSDAFYTAYVLHRQAVGKPFAIDELGGCETEVQNGFEVGKNNDRFLQQMSEVIQKLSADGIHLVYATLFMDSKWGSDATLDWV
jgi:hypothetical protein